jgi:hypothetical protein
VADFNLELRVKGHIQRARNEALIIKNRMIKELTPFLEDELWKRVNMGSKLKFTSPNLDDLGDEFAAKFVAEYLSRLG